MLGTSSLDDTAAHADLTTVHIPLLDGVPGLAAAAGSQAVVSLGNRLVCIALQNETPCIVESLPPLDPGARVRAITKGGQFTAVLLMDERILIRATEAQQWRIWPCVETPRDIKIVGNRLVVLTRGLLFVGLVEEPCSLQAVSPIDRRATRLLKTKAGLAAIGPQTVQLLGTEGTNWVERFKTTQCRIPTGLASRGDLLVVTDHEQGVLAWRLHESADAQRICTDRASHKPRWVTAAEDGFLILTDQGIVWWSLSGSEIIAQRTDSLSLHEFSGGVLEISTTGMAFWRERRLQGSRQLPGRCHGAAVREGRAYFAAEGGLYKSSLPTRGEPLGINPFEVSPKAVAVTTGMVAVATAFGTAVIDDAQHSSLWHTEIPAEPVTIAPAPGGNELACTFGSIVARLAVGRSPTRIHNGCQRTLDVYPWAMDYQGADLFLACGDGGLWRWRAGADPKPTETVPFAVSVAVSGALVACTTSAEFVLIDASSDVCRVIARRRLDGDVAGCAFQGNHLLVITGDRLAIIDPTNPGDPLRLVRLPFPPAVIRAVSGGVIVAGEAGVSLVTDPFLSIQEGG